MATEETVNTIAKALGEVEEQPMTQIAGVVPATCYILMPAIINPYSVINMAGR